jgi:hypothetical protein
VNPIGNSYVDGFGHQYFLHNAWNVDRQLWNATTPYETKFKPQMKNRRADGFLMVTLDGTEATCSIHGYRNYTSQHIWSVAVPAAPKF